ncbi:bifunctional diguanylate cyclase/phosphodiesterase [Methylobacterium radiotolerans]|uniref:bifunctional diguanylate cyclase/phosphodiesterase n=1 Tax=Methylobacterium radiotolerans TaxID=31998 RepID=UPI001F3CB72F|nr:EAL domain-containing protein [Methylobacterium radiotolerans]UIY45304.1 EAL domain-containing protein [Methylobacterium radiotolerans]
MDTRLFSMLHISPVMSRIVRPFRSRTLSATSLTAVGIVLSLILVGAGTFVARTLYDLEIHNTERSLASLTTLLAEQADRSMQAIEVIQRDVMKDLANASATNDGAFASLGSSPAMHERLRGSASALPQVRAIVIVDVMGRTINASLDRPSMNDAPRPPDLAQLNEAPAGRKVIVAGTARPDGSGLDLIISHPVSDATGRTLGYVLGFVDLGYYERLYARVSPDEADVISFVHANLTMLARHPRPAGSIGRKVPPLKWMQAKGADRPTSGVERMRTPIDGQDRLVAARFMEHYPIIMGTSRTISATLTPWRAQTLPLTAAVALLIGGVFLIVQIAKAQLRAQERVTQSEAARIAAEQGALTDRRMRDEYARFGTALDNMGQGVVLLDRDCRLVVVNARMTAMFDIPPRFRRPGGHLEVLLRRVVACMTEPEGRRLSQALAASMNADRSSDLVCGLADGRIVGVTTANVPSGGLVCTFEDVTERHLAQATIAHMAHHDALTGLANRVLLQEATGRLLAASQAQGAGRGTGALLLLDLDGFKQVNDAHGHPVGDALLRAVAGRLEGLVDGTDVLARLGGDEFAIVRFGPTDVKAVAGDDAADSMDAIALAERIVDALAAPFAIDGLSVTVGASIGIAACGIPDATPTVLLRAADIALYRAKAAARCRWCVYAPHMEQELRDRHQLEAELSRAFSEGQFELHYQPIVGTMGLAVTGYEALLRWRHPTRGLVPPAAFIPVCEETGLIREIGSWVLQQACEDATGWPSDVKVAVNLSATQFREGELVAAVDRALAKSGLPANRLELEITESVLLQDDQMNLAILNALHRMDVSIAMDDFGTGYSSLNYMRRFPFDKIKIDRTFVQDLASGHQGMALMRAAIALGHALGMTVLAEGVETQEARDILIAEGCDELQGYLFGWPAPLGRSADTSDVIAA